MGNQSSKKIAILWTHPNSKTSFHLKLLKKIRHLGFLLDNRGVRDRMPIQDKAHFYRRENLETHLPRI